MEIGVGIGPDLIRRGGSSTFFAGSCVVNGDGGCCYFKEGPEHMNIAKMMKQAADMQKNMGRVQAELNARTVEFSSGGGMVTATARGDLSIERIRIDPKVVDPAEVDMLEDLVTAAVDGALRAARDLVAGEMQKLTQGLDLPPGMKLPF